MLETITKKSKSLKHIVLQSLQYLLLSTLGTNIQSILYLCAELSATYQVVCYAQAEMSKGWIVHMPSFLVINRGGEMF